jgi:predicted nucleotidyltransferase
MASPVAQLAPNHQAFIDRCVAACHADPRVVAAFLGGSYAKGTADAHSDLDLSVITTDAAFENFVAESEAFLRQIGELIFLENFERQDLVFFIYADDTEGELYFGSESQLDRIQSGPYRVLIDKKGILAGATFPEEEPSQAEQIETLRQQIYWFWHELSHFTTAMARGQLWWAHGQLEALRNCCINLARLSHNFFDADAGSEAFFKIEKAVPPEQLAPLQTTYCPLERDAMLQSALAIVRFYQELAPALARAHGIAYPAALERVMISRLRKLDEGLGVRGNATNP